MSATTPHPKPVIASERLSKKRRQLALDASEQIAIMCAALREMMRHDESVEELAQRLLDWVRSGYVRGFTVLGRWRDSKRIFSIKSDGEFVPDLH